MPAFGFSGALVGDKWQTPAYFTLDEHGIIEKISDRPEATVTEEFEGYVLPGFTNAHSHAFQYAMAGRTESIFPNVTKNDFWSWRNSMYHLAQSVSAEDLQTIATKLYSEMLRNGYTSVVEFHYLHHASGGKEYANPSEHVEALCMAALASGIRLTIVPVFYHTGGFQTEAQPEQARFVFRSVEKYRRFLEQASNSIAKAQIGLPNVPQDPRVLLGWGVHSLRAATPDQIIDLYNNRPNNGPAHIHISEQIAEVDEAKRVLGAPPVQWLLDNNSIGDKDFLVHATHASLAELTAIAGLQATIVLCPSTEGNLGDGYFPIESFAKVGGRWAIGSDSHIGLSPWEELRWLDYQARLRLRARNPLASFGVDGHSGNYLVQQAVRHGACAAGRPMSAAFQIGAPFDAACYNSEVFESLPASQTADFLCFHSPALTAQKVFVAGRIVGPEANPAAAQEIKAKFRSCMRGLWPQAH